MAYNDLSLRDRAEIIRLGVRNGLKSLKDIRDFYDFSSQENHRFDDGGSSVPPSIQNQAEQSVNWLYDYNTAKQMDSIERERYGKEKQWLQNWYDKRLPAIGREDLRDHVTLGLQAPVYGSERAHLGQSYVGLRPGVLGKYAADTTLQLTPKEVLSSPLKMAEYRSNPGRGKIYIDTTRNMVPLEEMTHATQYGGLGEYNSGFTAGKEAQEGSTYLQLPQEQHARIMKLRYLNNLSPEKTDYTLDDLKSMKAVDPHSMPGTEYNVLDELHKGGMSDEDVVNALNTWASNSSKTRNPFDQGNNAYLAAHGGKIHIAPSKRGTFTAAATKHGKSVQAFASQVLANKENYSPAMVKKANFARNASHWHADGGSNYKVKKGDTLGAIARKYGVTLESLLAANPGLNPDRIRIDQVLSLPSSSPRRVDFNAYMGDSVYGGNRGRAMNIPAMEQFQDSLIARGFEEPQRLALLATAAQEMDARGAASTGIGGNGYLGLSSSRMPVSLLDDSPEGRGKQIHHVLEDLTHVYTGTHPQAGNWNDGGTGGPAIKSGQDGSDKFWDASDAYIATQILNKSYIRPAGRSDSWSNRANVAKGMEKHLHATGGIAYPFSFSKSPKPSVLR